MGAVVVLTFSHAALLVRTVLAATVPLRGIEVGAGTRLADASRRVKLAFPRRDLVIEAASEALSLIKLLEKAGSKVTLDTCGLFLLPLALRFL